MNFIKSLFTKKEKFEEIYYIAPSTIHGNGVFANRQIAANEPIFLAFDSNQKVVYPATMVNHCISRANARAYPKIYTYIDPNTPGKYIELTEYYLYALRNIAQGEEILSNYYTTPNFIKKPAPTFKDC